MVATLMAIFAFASPLGCAIGMALESTASVVVNVVFSSLAAGTFVYIACSEVVVEEFSTPGNRWVKLLVFIIGAGIITSLLFLDG
jgi:zinc transporter 1/2/3